MIRILFVDDEPLVLRALDRGLRTRTQWQTGFAGSGAGALELLERQRFDVIVSDISMPMMDGVTLLDNVRARYPHMTRLALSGEFLRTETLGAAAVVHQWIAKPCPLPQLCATIERLTWIRALISDPDLVDVVTGLGSLPSPPALYARVSQALARSAGMTEVVALIEHDPAVVSKLLQLVNSSFYSLGERVTAVHRAAAVVGSESLTNLLLAAEVFRPGSADDSLIAEAMVVSQLARELAGSKLAGDAFLAGLLHGVGALALSGLTAPPQLSPILLARIAGVVLGTWGLPLDIVTAVAFHRDPEAAPDPAAVTLRAVALAAELAAELATGERAAAIDTGAAALALDPASCRELAVRIRNGVGPVRG